MMSWDLLQQESETELTANRIQNTPLSLPFRPKPVQILRFENGSEGKKLVLDKENLAQIIRVNINTNTDQDQGQSSNSRLVANICIAGHTGGGKSFFLRHLIRYLCQLEKESQRNENDSDPMGFPGQNFDFDFNSPPFTFGDGDGDRTLGIWMWSKPFTVRDGQGRLIDIYVMDTQGVFDEVTGQREWSIIVGLSLLMSSTLIFNFTHDINENHLEFFSNFLNYGLHAKDVTGQSGQLGLFQKPFQKLVFLVRDWNKPNQIRNGAEGGKIFIHKKLEVKSTHSPVQQEIRRKLTRSFQYPIQCHLFPFPGKKALDSDFDGNLEILEPEFKDCLLECLSELVPSSSSTSTGTGTGTEAGEFPVNRVNGCPVTAVDYIHLVEDYVDKFNSKNLPEPKSLYELHLKIFNSAIVRQALEHYNDKMYQKVNSSSFLFEEDLVSLHLEAQKDVINNMVTDLKEKIVQHEGDEENRENDLMHLQEDRLLSKISKSFHEIRHRNSVKLEEEVKLAHTNATSSYREKMKKELQSVEFFDAEEFEIVFRNNFSQATRIFIEHFKLENSRESEIMTTFLSLSLDQEKKIENELIPELSPNIPLRLQEELEKFIFNVTRMQDGFRMSKSFIKQNAQLKMSSRVLAVVAKYKSLMTEQLDGKYVTDSRLRLLHDSIMEKLLAEFQQTQSSSKFYADAPTDIENGCAAALDSQQRVIINQNEEILSTSTQQVKTIVDNAYTKNIAAFSGDKEEDFESLHSTLSTNCMIKLSQIESVKNSSNLKAILEKIMLEEIEKARLVALEQFLERETGYFVMFGAGLGSVVIGVVGVCVLLCTCAIPGIVAATLAAVAVFMSGGFVVGGAVGWIISKFSRVFRTKNKNKNDKDK